MRTANAEGYVREQNGWWVVEVGGWAESTHFGAEVRGEVLLRGPLGWPLGNIKV